MKVTFITSAYLVTTNPYTKVDFNMLTSQISAPPPFAQREMCTRLQRQLNRNGLCCGERGPWKRISALPQPSMGILDFNFC